MNLTSGRKENDFAFQQVQVDTIILSAYAKLRESCNGTVIIDSEDMEVYVQAAYVVHNLPDDFLIKKKKKKHYSISNIENVLKLFLRITGCDHISGFYRHGRKSFKKIRRHNTCFRKLESV